MSEIHAEGKIKLMGTLVVTGSFSYSSQNCLLYVGAQLTWTGWVL